MTEPVDAVSLTEAAAILGCSAVTAMRLMSDAGLLDEHPVASRLGVEQIALQVYRWRDHLHDATPYWVTGRRAGALLGVNSSRLRALSV